MRTTTIVAFTATMLLPGTAMARQSAGAAAAETPTVTRGQVDLGVRGTRIKGDSARYERYRDLADGLFVDAFRVARETRGWFLDFTGEHTFASDQRLVAQFVKPGRLQVRVMYDQIPMIMSRSTATLFSGAGGGVLTISDLLQQQVQASTGSAALPGIVSSFARPFTLDSRRHIGEGTVDFNASPQLSFTTTIRRTDREGGIPFGGSFGHSQVAETVAPVSHTLTDVTGGGEWMKDRLLLRAGYAGSWFHNDDATLTFDNPFRFDDIATASSRGRAALPPSNAAFSVNGMASLTFPRRSRATAYFSTGWLNDRNAAILPYTVNTATTTLNPLPRTSVGGEGRTMAANLTFTSRPHRYADISVRFRAYEYENRTPEFDTFQRVSYDNAPSTVTTAISTEPFGILRQNFDVDFKSTPIAGHTAGVGYSRIEENRSFRVIPDTTEHVARVMFDAMDTRWFSVRTKYEHSQKRGHVEDAELRVMTGCQPAPAPCNDVVGATVGLEHVGTRHFDIADRDRNRFTALGTFMPIDKVSLGATVAYGKDTYTDSQFGLGRNDHWIYGANVDTTPTERTVFSVSFTHEHYNSLQNSRQANPQSTTGSPCSAATPTACQFIDPGRNWSANGHDNVNALVATFEILRIREKVDLRFSADFNRSTSDYTFAGPQPELTYPDGTSVVSTLTAPTPLPLVRSELQRGTADVTYAWTDKIGLGLTYWYERFDARDFTLDRESTPTLGLTSAVLLGYLYQPYTANTVFGRLILKF